MPVIDDMMAPPPVSILETAPAISSSSSRPAEIPIANIYFLLCYAWDALEEKDTLKAVGNVDSNNLLELFARVLVNGTRRLLRRGLDRGYLPREAEIHGVCGKLLVTQTLRHSLLCQGKAACAWDELEYNTIPNRILKATLQSLHDADKLDASIRADVKDLLRWLAPVRAMKLHAEQFRRIQLHRNNRIYSFLLNICEFIHENWLPTEQGSTRHFRDFVRDGLPSLFEKFVFNFYDHELPAGWHVSAPVIYWQIESRNKDANELLPLMKTDVCIRGPGRAIILDTKFYAEALKAGHYSSARLAAGNLYQLFTYLRQKTANTGWENAEGILLYPRTNRDFDADFTTQGHRIRALTLDLFQPWERIRQQMLNGVLRLVD